MHTGDIVKPLSLEALPYDVRFVSEVLLLRVLTCTARFISEGIYLYRTTDIGSLPHYYKHLLFLSSRPGSLLRRTSTTTNQSTGPSFF